MAPELSVLLAAVALPFVAAAATPPLHRVLGERTGYAGAAVALTSFLLLATQRGREGTVELPWVPSLDVALRFHVDGWALLFALLASGIGVLVFAYSPTYMHGESGLARYYAALLAFMGSILGVALAADLLAIFLFWELTSLCSFVLIGHHAADSESLYAARLAMLVTVGGGLFLLVGLLALATVAGDALDGSAFDLAAMLAEPAAMRTALREEGLFVPAMLLLAVGAATKSAQVPVHFWLPNAMAAPTPVSAFLHSATMVKVGVYFVGRIRPLFLGDEWTLLFATVGLSTMAVCAVLAVAAADVKALLAYSTASHLGMMIAGFGFASYLGAEAGAFHLFTHALFKASLFLVAGIVAHEAGTRRLSALGGLRRDLPLTAGVTAVVALSMAGIPPFAGFYSKELLFEAIVESTAHLGALGWVYAAVATGASVFTVLYSLRFLGIFVGRRPPALDGVVVHRPPATLLAPPAVLAALTLVVSVTPDLAVGAIVQSAVDATAVDPHAVRVGLPTSLTPAVGMSAVAIGLGVAGSPFADRLGRRIRALPAAAPPIGANWWYDRSVATLETGGVTLASRVHDGLLRTYASWTLGATCALALAGFAATGALFDPGIGTEATLPIALVLAVAVVAAYATATAPSHVVGVLTLSILGFMLAIFYILASAPDLALTQLVVETLVLVIFLLVIEEIPAYYEEGVGPVARDAALSLVVGATAFLTVVLATGASPDGPSELARHYTENAVGEGGGANVVNVILTDFRGFDTLGEIVVVAIAATSIITLLVMRSRGESG